MSESVHLAEEARLRRQMRISRRELRAEALVGGSFVVAAGLLVALDAPGDVPVLDLVLLVLAAALLGRLEFELGTGFAVPTQLVLVPMLFVLPPAIVPLAVVAAQLLDRLPDVVAGRRHPQRLLAVLGDAWFAVGPAVVFVIAAVESPSLGDWPSYILALIAQLGGELVSSTTREWLAHGVPPRLQLDVLAEVWLVDVLLSPIGLLAAYASTVQERAYLFVLPLAALLKVFASERRARIDQAIELSGAYRGTALLLSDVIENDDEYTGLHSQGVVSLALQIADELRVGEEERRMVEFGAMLHDIGKISTPKEILHKAGALDPAERDVMREHAVVGQRMLDRVGGMLHHVGAIVRASHERYDGHGYPDGLAGDEIPRPARIIAVADSYSAMTTDRPYRAALTHAVAVSELRDNAGTQFDPAVVSAALVVLGRGIPESPRADGASTHPASP